jgi:lipid II isoglutaminyl synthase (glutamine-hydrolysing)
VELEGMSGSRVKVRTPKGELSVKLPLPGLYNVYNAIAAVATALELGVPLAAAGEALERFGGAFGRVETIPIDGRRLSILLVKNPAGANEVLRTLTLETGELDLWLALNDGIADGRDVSWIWDADFEVLAGRVRRATCSGTRAEEMGLRLKYAGIEEGVIAVDRDLGGSLDAAVRGAGSERVYALPTYTALLDLRDMLSRRGLAKRWSE